MDSFAVSITSGVIIRRPRFFDAITIALFFGSFQAGMPILGWLAGIKFSALICEIDHWIAFTLLTVIGVKMIIDSINKEKHKKRFNPLNILVLLTLALATSLDAAAVGLSISFMDQPILIPALIIGTVTFVISFLGVFIGNKVGILFGRKVEFFGGTLLIGIGIRILTVHLQA